MRRFSIFSVILLCLAILVIDLLSFYWLQSITEIAGSKVFRTLITIFFFTFTIGLTGAILTLRIRLDHVSEKRRHLLISSLYGLTIASFLPKIIFVVSISTLYFLNYTFSDTESRWIVPIVGLLSGFLPFFVIVFAIFRTRYHFKVYKVTLELDSLPLAFNGLRIVQISDLHLGSFNYKYDILKRAISKINDLGPDLIVFTGDIVNNYSWELTGWEEVFVPLKAPLGKYAVLGNHDYGDYSTWDSKALKEKNFKEILDFFRNIDFKLLKNEASLLEIGEEKVALIGVENWGNPPFKQYGDLEKAMLQIKKIPFKILLSHDPTHWTQEVRSHTDIALTLSGHTHGMQAGFVYKSLQWSPIKYRYKHWSGLYTHKSQHLYVNKGLGWLGFPGRVGMRPEISCFDLQKENSG